jgi:hypothetical protein
MKMPYEKPKIDPTRKRFVLFLSLDGMHQIIDRDVDVITTEGHPAANQAYVCAHVHPAYAVRLCRLMNEEQEQLMLRPAPKRAGQRAKK